VAKKARLINPKQALNPETIKIMRSLFCVLLLCCSFFKMTAQSFTEVPNPVLQMFDGVSLSSIAVADINGDDQSDFLITGIDENSNRVTKLYANCGIGHFFEILDTPFPGVATGAVAFADVNGDDIPDALITGTDETNTRVATIYTNDGTGQFTEISNPALVGVSFSSVAFADINGDSHQDLLIAGFNQNFDETTRLYVNDGTGQFSVIVSTPFADVAFGAVAFADINGDNHQDVLITGNRGGFSPTVTGLYINDGTGQFTEVNDTPFANVAGSAVAFFNANGDAAPDLLLTGTNQNEDHIAKLFTNDGTGQFTEMTDAPFLGVTAGSLAIADVNNDSYLDVLISGLDQVENRTTKLYINDGQGQFSELNNPSLVDVSAGAVALTDVNSDSYPDLFLTGLDPDDTRIAKLYANDGTGQFSEITGKSFPDISNSSIAIADVNGDDYQDILIAGNEGNVFANQLTTRLYTNTGDGQFAENKTTPFVRVTAGAVAFADVNDDQFPDAIITGSSAGGPTAKLYLNDGTGQFSEQDDTPFVGVAFGDVAIADLNGDNHPDVLLSGTTPDGPGTKLYLNNGSGQFSELVNTPFAAFRDCSLAVADVNSDNHPDVFITGQDLFFNKVVKLYLNDGNAQFTALENAPFTAVSGSAVAFSDVNGDSHQDILITGLSDNGSIAKLYINDGNAQFTALEDTPFTAVAVGNITFTDVNNDLTEDVIISGSSSGGRITKLYINDGNAQFSEVENTPFTNVFFSAHAFLDINNDNYPDVLLSGEVDDNNAITKLYLNDGDVQLDYNICNNAADINPLFGQVENEPQVSELYHNVGYTSNGDPEFGNDCYKENDGFDHTIWYTFIGDGNTYSIRTIACNAMDYIDQGDTQMSVYSGSCSDLTAVACNEDEDLAIGTFNSYLELDTESGVVYHILIDGYTEDGVSDGQGEFCLEVTNLGTTSATNIQKTDIHIFPNPTTDELFIEGLGAERVDIFNNTGQLVRSVAQPGNRLDMNGLPAGMYMLRMEGKDGVYSARIVKE
jgi:hypothetical protein